jgi:hypothetical protein
VLRDIDVPAPELGGGGGGDAAVVVKVMSPELANVPFESCDIALK